MKIISTKNVESYVWGDSCLGWHLLNRDDFSVIQEQVPPGKSESKHYHKNSRQFFYILKGSAVMHLENKSINLNQGEGLEIPPGTVHKFSNESDKEVDLLVISVPKNHSDKIIID